MGQYRPGQQLDSSRKAEYFDFASLPIPRWLNCISKEVPNETLYVIDPTIGLVSLDTHVLGTFVEIQEVEAFPYDVQDLNILVYFSENYRIEPHAKEPSGWHGTLTCAAEHASVP